MRIYGKNTVETTIKAELDISVEYKNSIKKGGGDEQAQLIYSKDNSLNVSST